MHITIATAPQTDLNLTLDIKLVKSAILYADRTKLCSPAYSILLPMLELGDHSVEEQLDFLERIIPNSDLSPEEIEIALQNIRQEKRQLQGQGRSTISKIFARLEAKKSFERRWEGIRKQFKPLNQDTAVDEFRRAIASNLLEVHSYRTLENADVRSRGFYTDLTGTAASMVKEFVDVAGSAILDGSTYPLFDDSTRIEMRKRIDAGTIKPSAIRMEQAKQTHLASDLMGRLPVVIADAPMDEIIGIRNDLEGPLQRFRSGIVSYAEEIKSAPWDSDFPIEAEQLFVKRIQPAILDIEEAIIGKDSFVGLLVTKASAATLASGGVLSMILGNAELLSWSTAVAIGGTLTTSAVFYQAYKEWQKQGLEIEKNQLYFYYQVIEHLM